MTKRASKKRGVKTLSPPNDPWQSDLNIIRWASRLLPRYNAIRNSARLIPHNVNLIITRDSHLISPASPVNDLS